MAIAQGPQHTHGVARLQQSQQLTNGGIFLVAHPTALLETPDLRLGAPSPCLMPPLYSRQARRRRTIAQIPDCYKINS
ncbi:hypothetical protein GCM10027399_17200 [Curvibacter fontanus]